MNKRVIVPEGMEEKISKDAWKILFKITQAAENCMKNGDSDRRRILFKWINESKEFLKYPFDKIINED